MKPGIDVDGTAQSEADHFMKCPGCGEWFDMRDACKGHSDSVGESLSPQSIHYLSRGSHRLNPCEQ
jgi:hypothetical protein